MIYRALTGVVALAAYAHFTHRPLGTPVPWTHFRRGAVGTAALSLWFFAVATLPLGTATALNYTSSLFLAAFVLGAALRARPMCDMQAGWFSDGLAPMTTTNVELPMSVQLFVMAPLANAAARPATVEECHIRA